MALTDPHAVQLIDEVVQGNKRLLLGVVRPLGGTEPPEGAVMQARAHELYEVGTLGTVVRMLKLGDGSVRVMVQGLERARLVEVTPAEHWLVAGYEPLPNTVLEDARTEALRRTVHAQFSRVIDIAPYLGEELRSEEHTSELQSQSNLVCRLLLEKKKNSKQTRRRAHQCGDDRHQNLEDSPLLRHEGHQVPAVPDSDTCLRAQPLPCLPAGCL